MNKLLVTFYYFAFIVAISGCKPESPTSGALGNDRDNHGCISSAGYQWCGKENKCVRSWEIAEEKGFENREDTFAKYCQ